MHDLEARSCRHTMEGPEGALGKALWNPFQTSFCSHKPLTASPFRRLPIVRHNVLYESREGT